MFSLESPHRGDSNEYTQYTIFKIKKKITLNYPISATMGFCSKDLKNEFETAMVNEPSMFEPLKVLLYLHKVRIMTRLHSFPITESTLILTSLQCSQLIFELIRAVSVNATQKDVKPSTTSLMICFISHTLASLSDFMGKLKSVRTKACPKIRASCTAPLMN